MTLFLILYVVCGAVFTTWFLKSALARRDGNASGTGWAFRLMVAPSCILFWPALFLLYRSGAGAETFRGEWRNADLRVRRRHGRVWALLPLFMILLLTLALLLRTPFNPHP